MIFMSFESTIVFLLTLLHSERPKLYTISECNWVHVKEKNTLKCMPCRPVFFFQMNSLTKMDKKFKIGGGGGNLGR